MGGKTILGFVTSASLDNSWLNIAKIFKQTQRKEKTEGLLIQNDKVLEILVSLGLTQLQARTYLALISLNEADVQRISKQSNVARQDIYRIIPRLEQLGLVEEIIATPKQYRAISLNEGTLSLYQKKIDEHTKLKNNIESLVREANKPINNICEENKSDFIITNNPKRVAENLEKTYSEALYLDIILPGGKAIDFMAYQLYDCISKAISNNAKIRIITTKTMLASRTQKRLQILALSPNFKIKFVDSMFVFCLAIVNKKEVNISISAKGVPSLWTNNCQVVSMSQLMFENQWNAPFQRGQQTNCLTGFGSKTSALGDIIQIKLQKGKIQ
jgi:HTH-type transcriptional regulator, sugar sensing transcriptional regulator